MQIPQHHVKGARRRLEFLGKQCAAVAEPLAGTFKIACPYPTDVVRETIKRLIQIAQVEVCIKKAADGVFGTGSDCLHIEAPDQKILCDH